MGMKKCPQTNEVDESAAAEGVKFTSKRRFRVLLSQTVTSQH